MAAGPVRAPALQESNRYHIYVGNACPWCHRVLIALVVRGLQEHVSITFAADDPERASRGGWVFDTPEPIFGATDLRWLIHTPTVLPVPQYPPASQAPELHVCSAGRCMTKRALATEGGARPPFCWTRRQSASSAANPLRFWPPYSGSSFPGRQTSIWHHLIWSRKPTS